MLKLCGSVVILADGKIFLALFEVLVCSASRHGHGDDDEKAESGEWNVWSFHVLDVLLVLLCAGGRAIC